MKQMLILLLAMASSGCSDRPPPPLQLGVLAWPPYELIHLAEEEGFLDSDRVELVGYISPAELEMDYINGRLDAVFVTNGFVPRFESMVPGQRILYVLDISIGGDALLIDPSIPSLSALKGKRIACEPGPLGLFVLSSALATVGLDLEDVQVVARDVGRHISLADKESFAGVVTYEPFATQLESNNWVRIYDSSAMKGEIHDVLAARDGIISARREDFVHLVEAYEAARIRFLEDPVAAATVVAPRAGLTAQEFLTSMTRAELVSWEANLMLLRGEDEALFGSTARQVAFFEKHSDAQLPEDVLDRLIDASLVEGGGP